MFTYNLIFKADNTNLYNFQIVNNIMLLDDLLGFKIGNAPWKLVDGAKL